MKSNHLLAVGLIAAVGAASTPAMAAKNHTIKLKPSPTATVKIYCINSYLRRNAKSSVKFTRITNNWLEVFFKKDVSDSKANEILDAAKVNCGAEES